MGFGQGGVERVKSVKMNRAQLNNRKRKGNFKSPQDSDKIFRDFEDHTRMSPEDFETFKKELSLKVRKRTRVFYLTLGITVVIVIPFVIYLMKIL